MIGRHTPMQLLHKAGMIAAAAAQLTTCACGAPPVNPSAAAATNENAAIPVEYVSTGMKLREASPSNVT